MWPPLRASCNNFIRLLLCIFTGQGHRKLYVCMGWDGPETSAPISYMLLKPPNIMGYTADFDWMYFGGWTHLINHAFLFLLSLTMFIFL
jgi:hypothetical protein